MGERFVGNKDDLRVLKTDRAIRKAALSLMQRSPGRVPAVKDIASEAEINKSTFYYHYESSYALIETMESELLEEALSQVCTQGWLAGGAEAFLVRFAEFAYGPSRTLTDVSPRLKPELLDAVASSAGALPESRQDARIAEMLLLGLWGLSRRLDKSEFDSAIPALASFIEKGLAL